MLEPAALVATALVAQRAEQAPFLFGMRGHHPAFARRDLLVRIEREDGAWSLRSERSPLVPRAECLARVVDEREPVPVGDRAQLVELAGVPVDVDGDDRLRPRRHRRLDRRRVDVERARVDVGEYRDAALVHEAVRRRRERVRRRDHLVAGADAGGDAEEMEACRPGRDRGRVRRADLRREELLEAVDHRPEREPARAHDLEHELRLALVEVRPRERDRTDFLLHACVRLGAYSSHCAQRSLRPCTVSRYACCSSTVIGPGGPIRWSSTSRIGVTSAAVPTMNTSSAR